MDERYTFATERGQQRLVRVKAALKKKKLTAIELAARLHMGASTARAVLRYLRRQPERVIHIAEWKLVGANYTPVYGYGAAPDVPKPMTIDRATKHQLYMARLKEDADRLDLFKAKQRMRTFKPRRDALAAWIPVRTA